MAQPPPGDGAAARARRAAAAEIARQAAAKGKKGGAKATAPDPALHQADTGAPLAVAREAVEIRTDALIPLDPDQPRGNHRVGTQARRVWAPDRLIRGTSPSIDQPMWDAAHRLVTDYLIGVQGARPGDQGVRIRIDPWDRLPYSEQRAMRRQSFERAMKAAGLRFSAVLVWCVLQVTPSPDLAPTVERWAESVGMRTERAVGWLAAALEVLAMHYGYRQRRDGGVDLAALGLGDGA